VIFGKVDLEEEIRFHFPGKGARKLKFRTRREREREERGEKKYHAVYQ